MPLRQDLQQVPDLVMEMLARHRRQAEEVAPLAQMMTAMPVVKPTITGAGMYLMTTPSRASPMASSMMPAISVAICSPSMPWRAVMPDRITMKAPVGPAICTRLPPQADTSRPAMMAV